MTLYQWRALNEKEQAETVWTDGVEMGEREDENYRFILYQVEAFYVEVYFSRKDNKVARLRAFSNPDLLLKYLETINIDELL